MVNSCGDDLGILVISVSYDNRFSRTRVNVLLYSIVVVRVNRGSVLVVMYFRNVSGVIVLRRAV